MAMKKCKECGEEISSSAKKCPKCGKDQRNFFMKHPILYTIIILIVIVSISNSGNNTNNISDTSNPSTDTTQSDNSNTIKSGTYLVGTDIESGLYKVTLKDKITKMGYVERASSTDLEFDSILANIILTGDGYVEVKDNDVAVKLTGVEMEKIDLESLEKNIKTEVSDGIYLVGYDIEPGRYKVTVTDTTTNMAYIERASAVSMGMEDIIANEIVQGQGYVEIKPTDFAVRVQGANLSLSK